MVLMRGSEAFLEVLRDEGVRYIFGNPGTTEMPLMEALADHPTIQYVLTLHESVAVAAAAGYAQASDTVGVVNLHGMAGLGNGVANLYNADLEHVPLLVTAGQQHTGHVIHEPLLYSPDMEVVTRPFVKWAYEPRRVEDLALAARRACKVAMTRPRGATFLSLPMDLMSQSAEIEIPTKTRVVSAQEGERDVAAAIARLLLEAQSPAIVVGDGVASSHAVEAVMELAEAAGARIMGEPSPGLASLITDHPLAEVCLPLYPPYMRERLEGTDLIVALEAIVFQQIGYSPDGWLPRGVRLVHVHSDPWEVGKSVPAEIGVVGDVGYVVPEVTRELRKQASHAQRSAIQGRKSELASRNEALRARSREEAEKQAHARPIAVPFLMHELSKLVGPEDIIVDESITSSPVLQRYVLWRRPGTYYGHGKGGGLGWALGAAIGVQLANPDKRVVCVLGDGATCFAAQGLWTAAHHRLPITFLVVNNRCYRVLKDQAVGRARQQGREAKFLAMDLVEPEVDFPRLAEAFGVLGLRVTDPASLAPTLAEGLDSDRPVLIDVAAEGTPRPIKS